MDPRLTAEQVMIQSSGIKSVWIQEQTDQWNRTENLKVDPSKYITKTYQTTKFHFSGEKMDCLINSVSVMAA